MGDGKVSSIHCSPWRVSGQIGVLIALSPTKGRRCPLNRRLVGSESCVDISERIKSAAFARNPKCRRGAEVTHHKDYSLIIDRGEWTASICILLAYVITA
jgi:hypothetical protein